MNGSHKLGKEEEPLSTPTFLTQEEPPITVTSPVATIPQSVSKKPLKRKLMRGVAFFLTLLLVGSTLFFWLGPKQSNKDQALTLYHLIDRVDEFRETLTLAHEGMFFSYQNILKEVPPITSLFSTYQEKYHLNPIDESPPFDERWKRLVQLIEGFSAPEVTLLATFESLPQVETEVIQELRAFNQLIIALADDIRSKRSFSIETIRLIDQLTTYTTRVENSLVELFSPQQTKQATLFATLTENFNALHQGLYFLEQGDYNEGVQSLLNSDFDEALREARFIFSTLGEKVETLIESAGFLVDLKFFMQTANDEISQLKKELLATLITLNTHDHKVIDFLFFTLSLLLGGILLFVGVVIIILQLAFSRKGAQSLTLEKSLSGHPPYKRNDSSTTISPLISPIIRRARDSSPLHFEAKTIINQVKVLQEGLIDVSDEVSRLLTEADSLFKKRDDYFTHLSSIMHKINLKLNYLNHNLVSLSKETVSSISTLESQDAYQTVRLLAEISGEAYQDYKQLATVFSNYKKEQKLSHQNKEQLASINEQLSFFVSTLERVMTHDDLPESDPPTILPL